MKNILLFFLFLYDVYAFDSIDEKLSFHFSGHDKGINFLITDYEIFENDTIALKKTLGITQGFIKEGIKYSGYMVEYQLCKSYDAHRLGTGLGLNLITVEDINGTKLQDYNFPITFNYSLSYSYKMDFGPPIHYNDWALIIGIQYFYAKFVDTDHNTQYILNNIHLSLGLQF